MSDKSTRNQNEAGTSSTTQKITANTVEINSTELGSYNPSLSENDCHYIELNRLKGDAIGDTLYSERFVLQTLLKLQQLEKDLQDEEGVERDLCSLWDMTLENDVVQYLLKHDVLEVFANIIKNSEDKRLIEILVGILGNMCNAQETRNLLTEKHGVVELLLDLTSCMDSLTLEQLMRLLTIVFVKMTDDQIQIWYTMVLKSNKFVDNLCFILNNATNSSLILQTLESLNAILAKFFILKISIATEHGKNLEEVRNTSFDELFVQPELIECTIEAFKTLFKDSCGTHDFYEATDIPDSMHKAKQTFCNIHSILTQCQQLSKDAYECSNDEMLRCFKDILVPMVEDNNVSTWQQYQQDVLETLNDVLRVLPQPIDFEILQYLLKILYEVDKEQGKHIQKTSHDNDIESEDDNVIDHQISYILILNTLYYIVAKAKEDILKQYIKASPRKYSDILLKSFEEPLDTEYMKNCFFKLKVALEE